MGQAAKGARDQELIRTIEECAGQTEVQQQWLATRLKAAAPQALLGRRLTLFDHKRPSAHVEV